jgi:hypothetical protein
MDTLFLLMSSSVVGAWVLISTFAIEFIHQL